MNKFSFKLEPLYEFRQRLEELSRKEFSEALRTLSEEESKLAALKDLYRKSSEEIDKLKEENAAGQELDLYYTYVTGLKKHIEEQARIISSVKAGLEEKRRSLIEASKNKKAVEILKERSYNLFVEGSNREAQKISDDMAAVRFKRKTHE